MEKINFAPISHYGFTWLSVEMFQDDVVTFIVLYEFMLFLVMCIYVSKTFFDGFDSLNIYLAPCHKNGKRRPKLWKTI